MDGASCSTSSMFMASQVSEDDVLQLSEAAGEIHNRTACRRRSTNGYQSEKMMLIQGGWGCSFQFGEAQSLK
jgi:hypothetical protein